jgi:hypothetical protein
VGPRPPINHVTISWIIVIFGEVWAGGFLNLSARQAARFRCRIGVIVIEVDRAPVLECQRCRHVASSSFQLPPRLRRGRTPTFDDFDASAHSGHDW